MRKPVGWKHAQQGCLECVLSLECVLLLEFVLWQLDGSVRKDKRDEKYDASLALRLVIQRLVLCFYARGSETMRVCVCLRAGGRG